MQNIQKRIVDGLCHRAGLQNQESNEYSAMSLREIAVERLRAAGQDVKGFNTEEIFSRAMQSTDFANILADVANKALLEGFQAAEETYDIWVDTSGRVNDFKAHVFARASEAPSLVEVNPDGGEYAYGKMSDAKETVAVVDYGIIMPFTRKSMINDDIGALTDTRTKLGEAARRKYGDLVYAVLTGNPTMGDGNNLFDANNHGNYVASGSGAPPSVATLNLGSAAMATQKDILGEQLLNMRPMFIIAPWALKGTVDNLLTTTTPAAPGSAASPTINPWSYLTPVYDARLDASVATQWFLAGRKGLTVKLFTLNGNKTPFVDSKIGWASDGIEFKARITAAAKAMGYQGLYCNSGA